MATLILKLPDFLTLLQHHMYLKVLSYCNLTKPTGDTLKRIMSEWSLPLPSNYNSYELLADSFQYNYDIIKFSTTSKTYDFVVKPGRTITNSVLPISINQSFHLFMESKWMMGFDLIDFDESTFVEFVESVNSVICAAKQTEHFLIDVTSKYETLDSNLKDMLSIGKSVINYISELLAPICKLIIEERNGSLSVSPECLRPQLMYIRAHIYKIIFICLLLDYSTAINGMTYGMQSFIGAMQFVLNKCLDSSALHRVVFSKSYVNKNQNYESRGEDDNTSRVKMYFEYPQSSQLTKVVSLRIDLPHKGVGYVHLNFCGKNCMMENCINHKRIDISEDDTLVLINGFFEYLQMNVPDLILVKNDKKADEETLISQMSPYIYCRHYFATHKIDEINEETEIEDEFCKNIGLPLRSKLGDLVKMICSDFKPDKWLT